MIGVAGVALVLGGGFLLDASGYEGGRGGENFGTLVGGWGGALGYAMVFMGVFTTTRGLGMRRRLRSSAWRVVPCRYREIRVPFVPQARNGEPTLVLGESGDLVTARGAVWRWGRLSPEMTECWVAGDDPAKGLVVSPDGGDLLIWAKRPRFARFERWLRGKLSSPASSGASSYP